ncbi:TonB-dependent receptor [Aliifodinibius sp. S!AR15-10]|uniref:TonB-dependent receptor n=1 Tax=Aliifodinibius sp. S!AR15-10 TaxID=2950437 RepID=UPI00285E7F7D|nr:TonB-dependent receptor [Aliifodinibius sp. S!AR15-10]MDR8392497.1 TonB-dependent receptor [Aliifodinibius sp. S!AR15-10]
MKRLTTIITLIAGLFTITGKAMGQTYSISGKVTNGIGQPLPVAYVFIADSSEGDSASKQNLFTTTTAFKDKTGSKGRYRIDGIEPGRYTVTAFYPGKKITSRDVIIKDTDLVLNLELALLEGALEAVTVEDVSQETFGITRMRSVEGVTINESKKNEVVVVDDIAANLATNNSRQVFAKVAGLNIWQSDGAGVQLGIGGRGLSPNRSSNFNTRQNGYDIAADALGYPESYYTPPVRALKRIEIVRGAASLQYGTQFGGLLNFVFKDGPENEFFEFNSNQTVGSYGLLTSFNSIGGSKGKANYYGFFQYKKSNGWRPNSELDQHTGYASVQYKVAPKLTINPEYTRMYYLAQQPGGLTDAQFEEDPTQSNRERNWFRVNWNLFAIKADYRFSSRTRLNTRFFGLVAGRDAVGNLERIDRLDFGGPRNLLKDDFRNWGNETRLIHRYSLLGQISVFLVGTRFYNGFTHRRQGLGTDGSDPDFSYLNSDNLNGSDFDLPSRNRSVFVENIFNITPNISITPGVRFEYIRTEADGYYRNLVKDLAGNILVDERILEQRKRERSFVFFGIGASYKSNKNFEIYTNYSQNYRAMNFNDIRVDIGSLEVDPNIKDERGFNVDLGIRGSKDTFFNYDLSLFHLSYEDRIGTVLKTEPNPKFNGLVDRTFRYRTNVADAKIYGLETFAEVNLYRLWAGESTSTRLSLFSNLALITSEYAESETSGIEGNEVELVPKVNFKTGVTFGKDNFEATYQFSYVGEHYSDATNARQTPTAIEGIIPAYHVMDLSAKYSHEWFSVEAGVNNLNNHYYFTRRATGYPGPGIIPSKGRSFYLTLGVSL